ncbi:hsp70-binding protein 1 isoform X2 [Dendrobates tinctorius]|uniref:hsp70-binding protein 1 isoform X2 n=1 Tax=Dendrobates tinctorius TaxID=92724 RepID=UPI003CC9F1E8
MVPDSAGSIQPVAIISPVCPQLEAQTLCAPTPCDVSPATRLWNIMAEEEGRQHPRSLQGLLHMAIEAGTEPGSELQTGQMSHERRQWLQEAMSSAFSGQADEVQQMKECLRELSGGTSDEDGAERKEKALELLADLCENLDNASDFCKLGGMSLMLTRYLSSPEAELRWRTADLIGTCSQNVPFVQEMALSLGAVSKLLKLLDLDTSETVRIKALFAISCLVREQEAGLAEFVKLDGFSVLMRAMQTHILKLKIKSAFLLQNLLISHPEYKSTLCAMGMIQQLVSLLRTEHSPFHEHVLSAMCSMATDFPQGVAECQAPELAFEDLLKERCKMVEKQEEYQEELDYCQRLLKICFRDNPEDNGMDR